MIDLYTWPTPNGHKVHIMLEECGLPYAVHAVDIGAGEQFDPAFLAISPNNKIPAIVDSDGPDGKPMALFESGAILVYLAGKTGKFLPKTTRGRYEMLQWLMFQMGGLGPMLGQAHHFRNYAPQRIDYAIERYDNETKRLYGVLDAQLHRTGAWLVGREYTIADMACWPWVRSHENHGISLDDHPNVKRWYETMGARQAVQRAITVLADRRRPLLDPKAREALFGKARHDRR
jgi:GST-like protein